MPHRTYQKGSASTASIQKVQPGQTPAISAFNSGVARSELYSAASMEGNIERKTTGVSNKSSQEFALPML